MSTAGPASARATRRTAGRPALSRAALVVPAVAAVGLVVLPLLGLLLRTDWADLGRHLSAPVVWPAIRLSLLTTVVTVLACFVLGTPLAWLLARADGRLATWLRAVMTVPVVLPPVVGGVALLMAYGRRGLVGRPVLEAFGVSLPFTPSAVVLAQVFVSLPFYVLAVEGAMRAVDARYDAVAATLGASPLRTFTRVALPLAAPGVVSGAALAWARALGEFGATITFAGNFAGRTQTAPLAVYVALQSDPQAALALSIAMLAVSVLVLGLLRGRWMR
ncbi:molybdate ABC transporter permease subunit [Phycicoccus sp. CSK15P-2]|uniref:ABC transporter permease n=1 Tax=Phycicoccus sp. CSK15P-2 TaxID=2807627 RepID=UPI00194FA4D9|nr:ABC transporter permease [Phycicoccus sp. CSK15P-2]MBM6403222.1 molybdate ABC transporter permease subunit [Phycicoccus sp. CSK15P-2]